MIVEQSACYVSWPVLKVAIERLSKTQLPDVIDAGAWPDVHPKARNYLIASMKFLGLIDYDKRPTAALRALVETAGEDEWKRKMREIFERQYAAVFARVDLKQTTVTELHDILCQQYRISGATGSRAVRFFARAADYLGFDLHESFVIRNSMQGRPGPRPRKPVAENSAVRTVQLKSGGNITLSADLDIFRLSGTDRKFVFDLLDQLDGYVQHGA